MAYDVDDADRFFGRDRDVAACLDLLANGSFAALVGPSGSGKSSIMRAGVLAALRERGHRIVLITPTARPGEALTALPTDADARTVLAVDQTEEVFTLCNDPDERRDFLDRLTQEATRRPVVLTMRGDRLTQVTEHAGFSRLVERSLQLVGSLDEEGLRSAVTGPATMAGLVLQPGLVDLLVREVRDDPGALPLLSHALQETWRRREGNTLTVDGYHASGGIHGAVAQSAEQLYGSMPADQRHLLRDLLLRLVSPGGEGEATRVQVPRRLIAADEHHEQLIAMLVDARLVTSDEGVLEITHEALARAWPRLRGWLDDDVEGQRIRHHLSGAADAWDTLGRPDSELYRGVRLVRALEWRTRAGNTLTDTERDFLDTSRAQSEVEEQTAAERARAQARLIRRLRLVLSGAVALLVLALAAGGVAAVQSNRAGRNAEEARVAAEAARLAALARDARRAGATSRATDDISLSLLLAAAGSRLDDSPETRSSLLAALARHPLLVRSAPPGGGYLDFLTVSNDGRWIASSDDGNRMRLYDAATNQLVNHYRADPPAQGMSGVLVGAFSPDSRQLAVIQATPESAEPVRLLDAETMQPTTRLDLLGDEPVTGIDVQFSADGRYLAATVHTVPLLEQHHSETTGYALVWDLRSPSTPPARVPTGTSIQGLALSPDGQTLYTAWPLTAYDVSSDKRIWRREDVTSPGLEITFGGTLLAIAALEAPKHVALVDPATGDTVRTLRGHRSSVYDIRFSPDGSLVGSVSDDGELIVWRTETGEQLERWETFDPWGVGFSPENDLVYGGGGDSMLRTWDLTVSDAYLQQTTRGGDTEVFAQAQISPDGQQAAYRWVDEHQRGWVRFVHTETGERTPRTRSPAVAGGYEAFPWGAWHPDGGRYAGYSCGGVECAAPGEVTILDSATGRSLRDPRDVVDGDGDVVDLAYVDGGRSLLVSDNDRVLIIDAETLRPSGGPYDVLENTGSCCTTPIGDGSTAMIYELADGESMTWKVIDLHTGAVRPDGEVNMWVYASVGSPDGSTVAVAGDTGEIVTLDVSTGEKQHRSTSLGAAVRWLDYSDDGELLVSGAADGGVSLWDAATLDPLGTVYPPHSGKPVPAAAQFVGDSHDVVIASYDGTVYRWETRLDRALDFACQMAGRDLTEEEWDQYLPGQPYRSVCP